MLQIFTVWSSTEKVSLGPHVGLQTLINAQLAWSEQGTVTTGDPVEAWHIAGAQLGH